MDDDEWSKDEGPSFIGVDAGTDVAGRIRGQGG